MNVQRKSFGNLFVLFLQVEFNLIGSSDLAKKKAPSSFSVHSLIVSFSFFRMKIFCLQIIVVLVILESSRASYEERNQFEKRGNPYETSVVSTKFES